MDFLKKALVIASILTITGCSGLSEDTNPPTGNIIGPVIGGAAGISAAALLGAPKPIIGIAGVAGAGLGYYFTTLRFASSGIIAIGGHVYTLGDLVIIDVPTDRLFDTNTADFLPGTDPILSSIASILARYPSHNVFISGNTSGSWTRRFEHTMSECRASQVASYLWAHGITDTDSKFETDSIELNKDPRRLIYVGYGNDFPIANSIRLNGIRANSHIQIVASPSYAKLHWNTQTKKHFKRFDNIGDSAVTLPPSQDYSQYNYAFSDDHMPAGKNLDPTQAHAQFSSPMPPTESTQAIPHLKNDFAESPNAYNNVVSTPQTVRGASVRKHRGYKDEDFKFEGASSGR